MNITDINELEYRLLFAMVVAGKSGKFAENALKRFLQGDKSPFGLVRELNEMGQLRIELKKARTGNYDKLTLGFMEVAHAELDLRTVTPADLEKIHGIGPKTSRFFVIWTRPGAEFAALDTHVLKWLRYLGHKAPLSTPSGAKYAALEKVVLAEAVLRGMTARELDAAIWDYASRRPGLAALGIWPAKLRRRAP